MDVDSGVRKIIEDRALRPLVAVTVLGEVLQRAVVGEGRAGRSR